ncbi:helix-hairpin-helix domain-containing protein [Runella sp. MFBS21]|uniref:DNA polymerase/3'-5' exonuclease PolX n=1 Tax=Runella sp. MFBS21 TaxID=3034018 RepID=UPI0023F94100|nr:DNA polymerase/3'-5' exonuclease PolX [Runella sp. MFBS21]MDF7819608.1 helix-hairpin-helix domain-containing protein [Runella sp. MFBS21]
MSNDQIVEILELTVKLMELHNTDTFKTRTLANATFNLDRFKTANLAELPVEELVKIQGVGKSMAQKIVQLVQTGHLPELDELIAQTPTGVLEMFKIKGIGPKKIGTIWRDLGIESIQALKEACENGQIAKLKGFGAGTQQKILDSLAFMESQAGKLRMDKGEALAAIVLEELQKHFSKVAITGDVARKNEIVETIQLLVATESPVAAARTINQLGWLVQHPKESSPFVWRGSLRDRTASTDELPPQGEEIEVKKTIEAHVEIIFTAPEKFENDRFIFESSEAHLALVTSSGHTLFQIANSDSVENVEVIYQKANLPYVVPEMREGWGELEWLAQHQNDDLITWNDLKGILHNHSTYSDGKHSLETMARFCKELGFEYLGIADHSQSAAYANGLREDRIRIQHEEIDQLNQTLAPFKIFKGIESDILGDGSLDYPSEILATFDYVVASVHSNLNMGIEKATSRLLTAIENPFTTILGHPTGRLLLAREGYPIDHKTIIDACAQYGVVIEINASPWRLDLDWRWIRYCMEKGVMLSINPDAHEKEGYYDMHYGVGVARKGGLTKAMTFNALSLTEIESYFQQRKK